MSKAYPPAEDGQWLAPRRRGFKLECCDCGLTHRLNFKLVTTPNGGKKILFQAFRENRSTGQIRRHTGIKIVRSKQNGT